MKERNIKLTIMDGRKPQHFVISLGDNGAEIRRAGDPVASRDASIKVAGIAIEVEEVP